MLFSDPVFIVGFLPAALLIFHLLRVWMNGNAAALTALVGLSMVFYAYWSVPFLFLLLGQIGVNYLFARGVQREPNDSTRRLLFWSAVGFNLCLLGYYKYRNFFLENLGDVIGVQFHLSHLIVPLAISFHTFQQIALQADVKDGDVEVPPLLNYVFFVMFFPQLIAGPIVLHREMGRQVVATREGNGLGLSMFAPVFFCLLLVFSRRFASPTISGYSLISPSIPTRSCRFRRPGPVPSPMRYSSISISPDIRTWQWGWA